MMGCSIPPSVEVVPAKAGTTVEGFGLK